MGETAALLAQIHKELGPEGAWLIVVGDGDAAGDRGALEAARIWETMSNGGKALRLRPKDKCDLSDAWVDASARGAERGWWEHAFKETFEAAVANEWEIASLPVLGGAPAMFTGTVMHDENDSKHDADDSSEIAGDAPLSYDLWPNRDIPAGLLYFIVHCDVLTRTWLVRATAATPEELRRRQKLSGNIGKLASPYIPMMNHHRMAFCPNKMDETKLLCEATIEADGTMTCRILEEYKEAPSR